MGLAEIIRTGLPRVDPIAVTRTALNPLLWLVGVVTPPALILASIVGDPVVRMGLLVFAAVPIPFTMVVYLIWMFRDPDRLQSEEYRV